MAVEAHQSLHSSKCQTVGNLMPWLISFCIVDFISMFLFVSVLISRHQGTMGPYCKFGKFRENFIFANSIKRHICDSQSSGLRHGLHVSVNNRLNLLFREGFIFTKLRICEV